MLHEPPHLSIAETARRLKMTPAAVSRSIALGGITAPEAAQRLGISTGRLRHYIKLGRLPATRPGRDYKIDPRELALFKEEPRPNGRPPNPNRSEIQRPLCHNCHRPLRQPNGRTLCWRCGPDNSRLERLAISARNRRAQRKADGLCTECGTRPPETGVDYCEACREANMRRHRTAAA